MDFRLGVVKVLYVFSPNDRTALVRVYLAQQIPR